MEDTGWSIKTEFLSTSNFFPSASADTGLVLEDISLYLSRFKNNKKTKVSFTKAYVPGIGDD